MKVNSMEGKVTYVQKYSNAFSAANTYLGNLVQTKTYLQLFMLILTSIATVFSPYIPFDFIFVNDLGAILSYIITSFLFILPITMIFLVIMWEQRQFLFKKVTFQQLRKSIFYAFIIYSVVLLFVYALSTFTEFKGTSNPHGNVGLTNMLLKVPGITIQLIGENIMFASFLMFWYKIIRFFIDSPVFSITLCLLFAGESFGLLHFSTYNFNWIQCLFIIGIPAISHMIFFLKYKNIHMGYLIHLNYNLIIMCSIYISTLFYK